LPFSFLRIWLGVAALTTTVAFLLTYRSIRQSEMSNAWVDHTQRALSTLASLEGATGDLIFASGQEAISRASSIALDRLNDLAVVTADNAQQQARLKNLRLEIESLVRTRNGGDGEAENRDEATVPQSLSRLMREVRTEELNLLTSRVRTNNEVSQGMRRLLMLVATGSGTLLVWVFGLVIHDERTRHQVEVNLRRANEELDARVAARTTALHDSLDRERALRQEAETSSRLKDEFLMTVSHELRTPLNALLGWADMLRLGIVSERRQQRAVEAIYENAKLQKQLIADLLDTARILTGKLQLETAIVDLGQIVADATNVIAPAAHAKGLQLDVDVDPEIGAFVGDPSRLQQVVWNLVSNAVKFTNHGTVSVQLTRGGSDRDVQIVVADTGQGIGQAFLPHVFDRFRQEQTGTTRQHGGLGLGLAIVRQLVELHGGTIRAESDGEGHGAIFTVTLPRGCPPALGRDGSPAGANDRRGLPLLTGVHVLLVDDDAAAREMTTVALESCGADVTAAASANEARHALSHAMCDVFLVDIAMPGEDGYELMRQIRARGVRQPAAALTAQAREVDREQALQAGFDVHISKPVDAQTLARAVAALMRH